MFGKLEINFPLKKPSIASLTEKFSFKKPNIGDIGHKSHTTKKPNINEIVKASRGAMSFVTTWETFQNFTTSHGISHFRHAKGYFKKSLWLFSTLGCLIALCYNIYLISLKYLNYDVNVSVNLKHANLMQFPAVTICNNNPIKKSSLNKNLKDVISSYKSELKSFPCEQNLKSLQDHDNFNISQMLKYNSNYSLYNDTNSTEFQTNSACFPTSGFTEDGREQRSDYKLLAQMLEKYMALNHSVRMKKGHLLHELVYDCVYFGSGCNMNEDFTYFFNNYYGNCYTYNSAMNGKDSNKLTFKAGPRYGLSIIFNVDQKEYVGEISQSVGLRVVIHDPKRMPFPEDEAILVSPNALTHIGVDMIKLSKMNGLYGDCRSEDDYRFSETIYQKMYNLSYCEKGCHYTCLNDEIINRCSCIDLKFPMKWDNLTAIQPCSIDNDIDDHCVQSVWKAYKNDTLPCVSNCTVPCRQTSYKTLVSREIWPSANYRNNVKRISFYKALTADFDKFNEGSYGKVVVYMQDLTYTEILEAPFYELHEFTSDIGGVLGLYVGFSILTLVEFIELLIDMFGIIFYRIIKISKSRENKVRNKTETKEAMSFEDNPTIEVLKCESPLLEQRVKNEKIKKQVTESFSLDDDGDDDDHSIEKQEEVTNLRHL